MIFLKFIDQNRCMHPKMKLKGKEFEVMLNK